jgi:outer membrane protein assembly factor BamA
MPPYTFITLFRPFLSYDVAKRENIFQLVDTTQSYDVYVTTSSLTPGIGVELGSSKTDDILFPTSGNFLFFTPELFNSRTEYNKLAKPVLGGPTLSEPPISGRIYFYRLQTGLSSYIPANKMRTSVFATKLRIGYAQPFAGSADSTITPEELIPPNKTFYAGGSNSVRGWKARELVPKDTISYFGTTTETDQLRGGTFWFEGSFELRQKLNEYLGYAVFADYGNTWNGWTQIQLKDIAVALGFGIRIYTPIAPFRLDFGTKFYDPSDQNLIFKKKLVDNITIHFGIGEAF